MAWSNILIRAANWLGDAVMTLPALRAVRGRFPEARITVLARPWVADLYRREPAADEIVTTPAGFAARLLQGRSLGKQRFDAAILFPNSFESALMARWAARERIGYNRDGRGFLLTTRIERPRKGETPPHERYYYLELLRRAGIIDTLPPPESICLHGAQQARCAGLELFTDMGIETPVIGVSPGAQNSRAKQWPPDRFVAAARDVAAATGGAVALFGSAREAALCQAIAAVLRRSGTPVLSLAGETPLARFIELVAACRVFLTNDSGAMHVASALAVPTVAVFGPTDYIATAPAGPAGAIVREPVPCSPCMLRDCPIDHRCMTRIAADRVALTALELLK